MSRRAKPVTIVMIEDDEGHARLIEKNIRRAGINNEIVPFARRHRGARLSCSAPTARARSAHGRQLLILLDLNLPDMTGIDILAQVKAQRAPQARRRWSC